MEEELGMNLFLGDEFYEDNDDINNNASDDDANDDSNQNNDLDDSDLNNNEEPDEDTNPDGVDGDDTGDSANADDDDSSSPPLYKSLAAHLHDEGVLSSVDSSKLENINSVQDLADLIAEEVKAKELMDLTDLQKEAVEAFRAGIDVETFKQQKIVENNLDSITEEVIVSDQELREQLIYQDFINQGFSEQKAKRLTERSIEADDDIEDAKEALENIKKGIKEKFLAEQEFNNKQKADAAAKQLSEKKALEKAILETEEPIKGIKLNDVARKKVLSTMMNPISKNPQTGVEENELMKDQRENKDFSQRLYTVYALTKGFTDFSYFGKNEKNSTIKNLEKALKNNQHIIQGGDPSFLDDPNSSDFEIGDKLIL